jgi:hypothetical protein
MSRDEQRRRVPTSDELEQQGALAPATAPTAKRHGGLLRFFRAGHFRVPDDVAARKHVGVAQSRSPVNTPEGEPTQKPVVTSPPPPGVPTSASVPQRPVNPVVPRKIRIDPSVKERRGLGRLRDNQGSGS